MLTNPSHARRVLAHFETQQVEPISREGALPQPEPFGIAHGCRNPVGHYFVKERTRIFCAHCDQTFWEG